MKPPENYELIKVWNKLTDDLSEDIIQFWQDTGAVADRQEAERRVKEAAVIVRCPDNNIAGVITAYKKFNKQLDNYFFYLRGMVHKDHQQNGIGQFISDSAREFFEVRFKIGKDSDVIGLFMEIENEYIKKYNREANARGYIFVGKNARGDHCRVYYFDGAKI